MPVGVMTQVRPFSWTVTAIVTLAGVAVYVAEAPQRPMQDRMHGRHAGDDSKEIGFGRAPIDTRTIVVCAA